MKEICFEKIDSTSSYIKRSYQILDDYTFVAASYQSEGKGRNQRKWNSNNNENLLEEINKIKENDNAYFNIVRNNNYLKDKEVYAYYDNQRVKVKVIDINDDFSLKVLYHNKEINISSGEITFHNLDNEVY